MTASRPRRSTREASGSRASSTAQVWPSPPTANWPRRPPTVSPAIRTISWSTGYWVARGNRGRPNSLGSSRPSVARRLPSEPPHLGADPTPWKGDHTSVEDNKAVVARWFDEFWGPEFNPAVIDEIAAADIRFEYSLHAARKGREQVRDFAVAFRSAFPDLAFGATAELIAEGDYVVGQWIGGGTHTGTAMTDLPLGGLPTANTGKTMRFTGTTVLKVENGLITEEVGLDDGVTVLRQLGLIDRTDAPS